MLNKFYFFLFLFTLLPWSLFKRQVSFGEKKKVKKFQYVMEVMGCSSETAREKAQPLKGDLFWQQWTTFFVVFSEKKIWAPLFIKSENVLLFPAQIFLRTVNFIYNYLFKFEFENEALFLMWNKLNKRLLIDFMSNRKINKKWKKKK